jgi:hypothetical protein
MQFCFGSERKCRALASVIIRRRADTTRTKYNIATRKTVFECCGDLLGIIGNIFSPGKTEATFIEQLDELTHMFILATT